MKRRAFIAGLGTATAWPLLTTHAQQRDADETALALPRPLGILVKLNPWLMIR